MAAAILVACLLMLQAGGAAAATPGVAAPAETQTPQDGPAEPITRPVSLVARSMPSVTVRGPAPLPGWVAALQANPRPGDPEGRQAADITIAESAPGEVSLGAWIDYTFVLTNNADVDATLLVHDILPAEVAEDGVVCSPDCSRDLEVVSLLINMPTQYGAIPYTEIITTVRRINWENVLLPAHGKTTLTVSMQVTGQEDGTVLENRAYIKYELAGGGGGTALSNGVQTVVQVHVVPGSEVSISSEPTWYFEDYGGTGSVDWGDFDRDGNLDLVLGSSSGTLVYRSSQGRFASFWNSYEYAHDVHWADLGGDNHLELVAIGYDWWAEEVHNHIYFRSPDGSRFMDAGLTSLSNDRLLRALPVDHDGDGDLDLIAITYRRWTVDGCTIRLYPNVDGQFNTPYRCLYDPYQAYTRQTEDLLSLSDYDNDDDADLLVDVYAQGNPDPASPCPYSDSLWVLTNDAGVLTATQPITVDTYTNCSWAVDAAWGDYDEDGDLDLAVALPVLTGAATHSVRVYRNDRVAFAPAFAFLYPDPPVAFAFAVDWGDLDRDGDLDLAVAGTGFRVYMNDRGFFAQDRYLSPSDYPVDIPALDLALADREADGDLDVVIANPYGMSPLFTTSAGPLGTEMTRIASWAADSVAWGDADGDGSLDLLFGASETSVDAEIYYNEDGSFTNHAPFPSSGFGPHSVAFGDVNGDGELDVALGTTAGTQVYLAGNRHVPDWSSPPDYASNSLAWADADDDGDLDLLLGNDGPDALYRTTAGQLGSSAGWSSDMALSSNAGDDTRDVAWADVDRDGHLDLATANHEQPVRLYGNSRDGTFALVWSSATYSATTSLAWGDYDADGDLDLAVGTYGQGNLLYENLGSTLAATPIWRTQERNQTTSLAWGDWDNDGDLDLAVGNDGEADQVYLNRGSRPGVPQLLWLWTSAQAAHTTGLAWGDGDGDGDLDLAVSGEDGIGYYENFCVSPSHLADDFVSGLVLSNQPSYLSVAPPGAAGAAYGYASAERLSGPSHPTVTISYRFYDADGTRLVPGSDAQGDPLAATRFEYSVDGGGRWLPATRLAGSEPPTITSRLGRDGTFVWNALADEAISDNALFRVSIVHLNNTGQAQRTLTRATSPPFRVRGTTCTWPQNPSIVADNPVPALGVPVHFVGVVEQGQGILTFSWDFGDGTTAQWQEGSHAFARNGLYQVRLTVRSEPCPVAKEVIANIQIAAGTGVSDVHLPLIMHNVAFGGTQ